MSVDADLATLRHVIAYLAEQSSAADIDGTLPQDNGYAALARVDAELSRLREQRDGVREALESNAPLILQLTVERDAAIRTQDSVLATLAKMTRTAEAAEAWCARLQQALDVGRTAREALAGPDTPLAAGEPRMGRQTTSPRGDSGTHASAHPPPAASGRPDTPADSHEQRLAEYRARKLERLYGDSRRVADDGHRRQVVDPEGMYREIREALAGPDTPADSRRCQCPVGSYDRGNAVHADYCPLADSQPDGGKP